MVTALPRWELNVVLLGTVGAKRVAEPLQHGSRFYA